ncbi:MAG: MBL fold metallo-hydrolase [Cyclobacteriaceae bacterium]
MIRTLKNIGLALLTLILLSISAIVLFVNLAPQFGCQPSGEHLDRIRQSENYGEDQFVNLIETVMDQSFENTKGMISESINAENTSPSTAIPTRFGEDYGTAVDSLWRITWYGHSSILAEKNGKRIFLDPMLGNAASPLPIFGNRFGNTPSFDLDKIGRLDVVVFSHDHYDHLDYQTILAIKDNVDHFITPLGLGSHLIKWGVSNDKITELDWWENTTKVDIIFTATPARHFSGRGITDRNKTLWASWVIESNNSKLYFSGDGGYGPHFKSIGQKFGSFDFAMMECGQYNKRWEAIHMMPEQTVQATLDLNTQRMMPIHWGGFALSPHPWKEPAERVSEAAKSTDIELFTPEIGVAFYPELEPQDLDWWRLVD